jgi:imidazolonepropionase-like amidohydrolase
MDDLLIKAGRLFDGRGDSTVATAFVHVRGGRIAALGRQAELGAEAGRFGRVIDLGAEATLLPGLINMHVHMSCNPTDSWYADIMNDSPERLMLRAVTNLQEALTAGVTTVRDCGTRNAVAFACREAAREGLLVAPRVVASGHGITTTGGHCHFFCHEADSVVEVQRAVRVQAKAGADFIKLFATGGRLTPNTNILAGQFSESEMRAAGDEARRLGLRTASHALGIPGIETSVAARVTTIEHCAFLRPEGVRYDPALAGRIAEAGIAVCPTIYQGIGKYAADSGFTPTPAQQAFFDSRAQRYQTVQALVKQGVRIVAGSDAGVPHVRFGDFPGDVVTLGEGTGLPTAYVLKTATALAAEVLGLGDETGTLAPGLSADLLGVRGDPLTDLRALTRPLLVVAQGRVVNDRFMLGG